MATGDAVPGAAQVNGSGNGSAALAATDPKETIPSIDTTMSNGGREANNQLPSPSSTPSPTTAHPSALEAVPKGKPANSSSAPSVPGGSPTQAQSLDDSRDSSCAVTDGGSSPTGPEVSRHTRRSRSHSMSKSSSQEGVRKLSIFQITDLVSEPDSIPVAPAPERLHRHPLSAGAAPEFNSMNSKMEQQHPQQKRQGPPLLGRPDPYHYRRLTDQGSGNVNVGAASERARRSPNSSRTLSTPPINRRVVNQSEADHIRSPRRNSFNPAPRPAPLNLELPSSRPINTPIIGGVTPAARSEVKCSASTMNTPMPASMPLPPMSIPTHLQLELAGQRPSPLYIHQSYATDIPYESYAVKLERLKNMLLLPQYLERLLAFGSLACLDAWLYSFTILPIRFVIALWVLIKWWCYIIWKEVKWIVGFVWEGIGRIRRRRRVHGRLRSNSGGSEYTDRSISRGPTPVPVPVQELVSPSNASAATGADAGQQLRDNALYPRLAASRPHQPNATRRRTAGVFRHRRAKSEPSNLSSYHKADLLQGAVIIFSSIFLMNMDASRMYHFIRAQSALKLYVIYNLLEVSDRLLAAVGQDIMECLFSTETLGRNSLGRSKVLLPFGMFLLSLAYNVLHAVVLFFQVITLNVAVNSYSNALLTLLMSNQFVEIKSTVFKRFEKENLFQLTCADVVERFQLWIMLLIIGMRNVVEVGGLSVPGAGSENGGPGGGDLEMSGSTTAPLHSPSILPTAFTILPGWVWGGSGEVLSPFLIVIGSEMLVDSIKHAVIGKFNNVKPSFYGRILDILCKDYYTNAFVTPTLTKRLGLPLIPLSCLFIRASVQTYHMFLATHLPFPIPSSTQTSLQVDPSDNATPTSPAMVAALNRLDRVIRNALGRSVYGDLDFDINPDAPQPAPRSWWHWTSDDAIAALTMVVVFFTIFLVLLIVKLLLGMVLLRYSRDRVERMKQRELAQQQGKTERETYEMKGVKRVGGWGVVEVGDERRRVVYEDDPGALRKLREKERRAEQKLEKEARGEGDGDKMGTVMRYEMVAKRIW